MALKIKIDPIARDVEAMVRSDLSREQQGKAIAAFVKQGIDEVDQTNRRVLGRVPPRMITVDGRQGAALESVNPDGGNIIIEWELIGEVLRWIGKTLIERSPVGASRTYVYGHTLFVDGKEVPFDGEIPIGEEYAFTNYVPYARKIEIGKTKSGRAFVVQVPNRIYERTAKDAKARFDNLAQIFFTYRGIVGGRQINQLSPGHPVTRNARGRFTARGGVAAHNKSDVRFPTIYLRYRNS